MTVADRAQKPGRRALLVVNTKSRSGAKAYDLIREQFTAAGIAVLPQECQSRTQLTGLIQEHAGDIDLVAMAGGDGTMNAAAEGLIATGLPLGILPTGTANDLARTLGIASDLERAVQVIADGHTKRIDVGYVNDHPFFNVASIGLSAELASNLTRDVKRRFGRLGYLLTAMRVMTRARPFRATIKTPDRTDHVRTLQIAVGNGRYYGGGNAVEKNAAIDDRHLDLYSLEFGQAWKLALMARSFRSGEHGSREDIRADRAQAFEIETRRPRPINVDGDIVTQTPARFTVRPGAVTVFAPPRTGDDAQPGPGLGGR